MSAATARVVALIVPGEPVPKARPRFGISKSGKAMTYTDSVTVAGEEAVLREFQNAYPGWEPFTGPVAVELVFFCAPVKQNRGKKDADNLAKLVLDALNKKCWVDDYQVEDLRIVVVRDVPHEPYSWISVQELETVQ